MRRTLILTAAIGMSVVALVALARRVGAFSYFAVGATPVTWANSQGIRYLSPTSFPAGSDPDLLYLSAMGQWSDVPASHFRYFFVRNKEDFPIDNFDGFSDTIAVAPEDLDPGVIAVTQLVNSETQWFDIDMLFSSFPEGAGWSFATNPDCDLILNPQLPNGFSMLLVALHELGHGIGLGHDPFGNEPSGSAWTVATMNPVYPMGGTMGQEHIVELHADDRRGARFLYPHSGPSNPPVVDLGHAQYTRGGIIGRVEPVVFQPDLIDPGRSFVAQSVIENLGTSNEFFVRQGFYLSTDPVIESTDMLIGTIEWDLAFEDAFVFNALLVLPEDLPSGNYVLGSLLDDLGEVEEVYEDNNAVSYCDGLTVNQLAPVIEVIPQESAVEGVPYISPTPTVTHPLNMAPMIWSLIDAPAGMQIHPTTGVVTWPNPLKAPFLYAVLIEAANDAGSGSQLLFLGVLEQPDKCLADCAPGEGDGVVDIVDLLSVIAEWGSGGPFDCDIAPSGGDTRVNIADLLFILGAWGSCPNP